MTASVTTLLPLFLILTLAILLGRCHFFKKHHADVITELVYYVVLPITLCWDLIRTPLSQAFYWPYLATYLSSACAIILAIILISWRYFNRDNSEIILNAMASYHANTAYLALPIFLLLFQQTAPVASIMVLQSFFTIVILFLLEQATLEKKQKQWWQQCLEIPFKNPLIIGIILGLALNLLQWPLPQFLQSTLRIVSQSATFLAIFALGLSLSTTWALPNKDECIEIGVLCFTKLCLHPLLAYSVGRFVFHLNTQWLLMVTLIAGMPTAKNVFIFANRYQVAEKRNSIVVALTTLLAFITLNLLLWVLNQNHSF